uniref:VWFA domain-containing protein n=1 Tax=Penaeus semisulcatus majanivirus TaxID=2984274 RepID=A0A9C7CEP1_9VIRU|nr:MAG: hypothetical protein [Penaeus semisulcatus majanivirus]
MNKYPISDERCDYNDDDWQPPPMCCPDIIEDGEPPACLPDIVEDSETLSDDSVYSGNARLYEAEEKTENGEIKTHFLLKMPSTIPAEHTLMKSKLPSEHNCFNIVMADVSTSMYRYWPLIVSAWNDHVAPKLSGTTEIFVFNTEVEHLRSDPFLLEDDHLGGMTNLTSALRTIVEKVHNCRQKYIKVFLITDGDHNHSDVPRPNTVIEKMKEPTGKICDVYLLGIDKRFPVQYSLDIRSRLHNGSSNLPTLFWGNGYCEVDEEMKAIGDHLAKRNDSNMELSVPGYKMPGLPPTKEFHLSEWVYFPEDPEKYKRLEVYHQGHRAGQLILERSAVTTPILMEIVRQWNSVAIQYHNLKKRIPSDLLPFIERLFSTALQTGSEGHSLTARLARAGNKTTEVEFRTTVNKMKKILTLEKYEDALDLARDVLSTTVSAGKYEVRSLQLKGHSGDDYAKDCQEFRKVYLANKAELKALTVTPEDCCRVTMASTLSDLQDDDFLQLLELNKYEFLKQFTMSGIPVFSPTRDALALNPWSYNITKILTSPYTIMSQVAIESSAENKAPGDRHKDVKLKDDDDNTRFNAVIPVFTPESAKAMKPLVQTRLYAMCATFAVLKNPHIIDFDAHMAALASCWMRILYDHPEVPRPEHVRLLEANIIATASLYTERRGYARYCKLLRENAPQALMTESTATVEGRPVRCESLIKPMFMLRLMKQQEEDDIDPIKVAEIVRLTLLEFVGRNMSRTESSKNEDTPYTDLFTKTLKDEDEKREILQRRVRTASEEIIASGTFRLSEFYTLEQVQKAAKEEATEQAKTLVKDLVPPIQLEADQVTRLYSASLAGAVSWHTLKTYARDMGLSRDVIDELFSEKSMFIYLRHALQYKSSRVRLAAKIDTYEESLSFVTRQVAEEYVACHTREVERELVDLLQNSWLSEYDEAHSETVQPMTREQILAAASAREVEVTAKTFDEVYRKYRSHLGLLTNACQCLRCPFFLQPSKRHNQHLTVNRRGPTPFLHAFHQTAYNCRGESDNENTITELRNGTYRKREGRGEPVQVPLSDRILQSMKQLKITYSELDFKRKGQSEPV